MPLNNRRIDEPIIPAPGNLCPVRLVRYRWIVALSLRLIWD